MDKITLQEIITKKLNTLAVAPDDLITDAYLAIVDAEKNIDDKDKAVTAYIMAQVAIRANEACGISVPNIELDALRMKKDCGMGSDQEIADYYMVHLDK